VEVGAHNTYGHPAPSTLRGAAPRRRAHLPAPTGTENGAPGPWGGPGMPRGHRALTRRPARPVDSARCQISSPIYLVAGDDDERIDAWAHPGAQSGADEERGPGGLESFDAPLTGTRRTWRRPLAELSFATGTPTNLLVDGAEGVERPPLWAPPRGPRSRRCRRRTVLVLIVRGKPLKALTDAREARRAARCASAPAPQAVGAPQVGGRGAPGEAWGSRVEPDAAKELVARVGTSQQRAWARELEKLALAVHPRRAPVRSSRWETEASGDNRSPGLRTSADALVAGDPGGHPCPWPRSSRPTTSGPGRLVYPIVRRPAARCHRAARLLDAGHA